VGHLKDIKILSLIKKQEIVRVSLFFLLFKAIEYLTVQACLGQMQHSYSSSFNEIQNDTDVYILHNFYVLKHGHSSAALRTT
jgi:hypothetical protein